MEEKEMERSAALQFFDEMLLAIESLEGFRKELFMKGLILKGVLCAWDTDWGRNFFVTSARDDYKTYKEF